MPMSGYVLAATAEATSLSGRFVAESMTGALVEAQSGGLVAQMRLKGEKAIDPVERQHAPCKVKHSVRSLRRHGCAG